MVKPQSVNTSNAILRSFFKQANPLELTNDVWKLRNDTFASLAKDVKQRVYTLWPIPLVRKELLAKSAQYPFYLSFAMELFGNEDIKDVNIKVFRENVLQTKEDAYIPAELLLRAEWSNESPSNNADHVHAQPHWHIHAYRVDDVISRLMPEKQIILHEIIRDEMEQTKSIMDDEPALNQPTGAHEKIEVPIFRFHLAMVADWHKEKDKIPNKKLDDSTLKIWLPQCLDYIQDQVEYILKKMP